MLTFYYSFETSEMEMHFLDNHLVFTTKKQLTIDPCSIVDIPFNFHSNIVVIPEFIQGNFHETIAASPDISYQPCLSIHGISLANPSQQQTKIKGGTILFKLFFPKFNQLLGITRSYETLQNLHLLDRNNDIFNQPLQKLTDVIQASKLIDLLINKNYGFNKEDILQLQLFDLDIKPIYDNAVNGEVPGFIIKNKLLYKKKGKFLLLCTPRVLAKEIVKSVHTNRNFHFSKSQCNTLLSNLVWHPHLHKLVSQEIR